ncbi:hypothetical protein CN311_20415 [Mesorhizobium sanjuanii]|uniref:Uncharacterized protein n=2 Tax=Mesorhizobium sanjuanii TaxID=2037900 RepID=A0A2A6FC19_9HYPH|nr:hypothetical protein CN311_20415 [Mesorhizobium sanjuanii]
MVIHPQMEALWSLQPLKNNDWLRSRSESNLGVLEVRNGFEFAPLISTSVGLLAEINVTILRNRHSNDRQGIHGDIDNRVKTLFDALRIPTLGEINVLSEKGVIFHERTFCLLQDDDLVTKLTVETDRWLGVPPHQTLAIIRVAIKASTVTMDNLDLLS